MMNIPLTELSISRFKSIKRLNKLDLDPGVNVLIGANGAGKSNLISFFSLLGAMVKGELQHYSHVNGGADSWFFNGEMGDPIEAELLFGKNGYGFSLYPTASGGIFQDKEKTLASGKDWHFHERRGLEAGLAFWTEKDSNPLCWHIHQAIASWRVYHFHYTSPTAPLRRPSSVHDADLFYSDGSNLSAFLWGLAQNYPEHFRKIEQAIRQILPAFAGFDLKAVKSEAEPDNRLVWLYWKQKNSEYRFKPWQFSDGTLRFIALATVLLQPDPPGTIIIDEPELGLHPQALNVFAGLMHEAASAGTQVIVATQNPELLNSLDPENILTVNQMNGETRFERLNGKELEDWLEEYTMGELFSKNILRAGLNYV